MKETTKMSRAIAQIEKMCNAVNMDFFNGEIETPIITVQSKPGTWGHCSVAKIWKNKDTEQHEMNIAAESLDGNLEEILDTIIHEYIHLYCRIHGIKEVSRGGAYHNGKFKALAEERRLVCYRTEKYGWNTVGAGNEKLIEYILKHEWTEIKIGRKMQLRDLLQTTGHREDKTPQIAEQPWGRPTSTRKYQCPSCGNSCRATKDINILCMDCNEQMVIVPRA